MTTSQAKTIIKNSLEDYLSQKGINTNKPFHCLNPDHPDQHPSMSIDRKRQKAHCFSCGADYDTFDLIAIDFGLTDGKAIFEKAYEIFGIPPEKTQAFQRNNKRQEPLICEAKQQLQKDVYAYMHTHIMSEKRSNTSSKNSMLFEGHSFSKNQNDDEPILTQKSSPSPIEDHSIYFKECAARLSQTNYPLKRGLTNSVLLQRFQIGYDPQFSKGTGNKAWQALIIPNGSGSYVARNTDEKADSRSRYRKQGPSLIFNRDALQSAQKPIFVVEGEIDALSILSVGGEAVALGSTANVQAFLRLLRAQRPAQTLLLALDNAPDGQKASNLLAEGLKELQIPFYSVSIYGDSKDANEALLADPAGFSAAVEHAEHFEDEGIQAEREAYLKTSAANHLQSFINGIASSVDTPYYPTGFSRLDSVLDGGLYEGLYIIGAISSLGKTTLVVQLADQLAQQNNDVLIFSLEMARSEIMAKSLSRHTLLTVLNEKGDIRNAKTTRGITTGKRYLHYNDKEKSLIGKAAASYRQYAEHLFISEGIGNLGVDHVRETVRQHIQFTGCKPVVVVDYLQILSPYSERMTDKQNTDKAVMELKRISRDYKIPVIGISSFNRVNYKEAVTMEAFKESGAIEYSSDILIGLQLKGAGGKDFNANEEKRKNPRSIELVILKNRNGATGDKIPYEYYPLFNYFKEGS